MAEEKNPLVMFGIEAPSIEKINPYGLSSDPEVRKELQKSIDA